MKINSVKTKRIIVINDKEYVLAETDWTESIKNAKKEGVKIRSVKDVVAWVTVSD
jgi:tyrosine-protein phosphatase YwqE